MTRSERYISQPALPVRVIWCLLLVLLLAGCGEDSTAEDKPRGQISRPADVGLPLDNEASVAAFDVADRFLVKWFFMDDVDAAMSLVHPNARDAWRTLLEETEVKRRCSFVQVEGSTPDEAGTVVARYAIGGCMVTAPGGFTAVYIELTMTSTEEGPRIIQIDLLR